MLETVFWIFLVTIAYVYAGYPLLLVVAGRSTSPALRGQPSEWPRVTLVISAYNEEAVIESKLRNALETDYPKKLFQVLVVSDASDDRTDDLVTGFQGVQLLRMRERAGKTSGLNEAVRLAKGEIVVFSDANAMYERRAIKALVEGFSDPDVGAVVGQSTYVEGDYDSERSEGLYWRYETWLKIMESRTGSVVGGDGAIYAIRRERFEPMAADALSDFVNPLQIVRGGFRCVYEPGARSIERAADSFEKEFRRKVRIVNRAWRAMVSMKSLLNPFVHGWFAVKLISHKVLRWWVPVFLIGLFLVNLALWDVSNFYRLSLVLQLVFYLAALTGWVMTRRRAVPAMLYVPYYFCLVNLASLVGMIDAWRGLTYTTWSTARTGGKA